MKNLSTALSTLLFFFSTSSFAAHSPLVGTWILDKSENPMPDGSIVSYCTGVHGLIIYTEEGYVSVALNCDAVGHGQEPADISGRKFFYAGTYEFDGAKATHKMLNASQPELIGETFSRDVTIKGDELILTGVNQGQTFSAYWRRASPPVTKQDPTAISASSHFIECPAHTELYDFFESPRQHTSEECWDEPGRAERGFTCVKADNGRGPGDLWEGTCFGGYLGR